MNEDCQFLILEHLSLPELVSIIETNEYFKNITADVFKRKFSKKLIKLHSPFSNSYKDCQAVEMDDGVKLHNFKMIFKVLRHFGHLIKKLEIEYRSETCSSGFRIINELINVYCSKSLTHLHVLNTIPQLFDDYKKPFENVLNISFPGSYESLGNSEFSLTELFPSVQRMSLSNIRVINTKCINSVFPHLEYVDAEICSPQDEECFTEADLMKFIRKNPHIRSLKLRFVTRQFLKFIAENLKNLETLQLNMYHDDDVNGEIRFDNLHSLKMMFSIVSMPSNTSFKSLTDFQTDAQPKRCSRWIDFVENSKTLTKLGATGRSLRDSEIERLALAKLNLTEVVLMIGVGVEDETLVQLIKNSKNLKKINLIKFITSTSNREVENAMKSTVKILKNNFRTMWNVNSSRFQITLDKKI